jgi:hypothetical protein
MTACRIERRLGDVDATLTRAKLEAAKFRSVFEGDARAGHYLIRTPIGTIEGTYSVAETTVCFVIEKKSAIIPCAVIERVLDEFLRAGVKRSS